MEELTSCKPVARAPVPPCGGRGERANTTISASVHGGGGDAFSHRAGGSILLPRKDADRVLAGAARRLRLTCAQGTDLAHGNKVALLPQKRKTGWSTGKLEEFESHERSRAKWLFNEQHGLREKC
ncbi:hypothetical protein EJB05_15460, partial [Eragrostis curvula]